MKIKLLIALLFLTSFSINAQRTVTPSETFKIEGKIKKEMTFSISDLDAFPKVAICRPNALQS
jgi:DMSO/TMAO reductase YedYZ molybdopterin-dependent catalytic subunit